MHEGNPFKSSENPKNDFLYHTAFFALRQEFPDGQRVKKGRKRADKGGKLC